MNLLVISIDQNDNKRCTNSYTSHLHNQIGAISQRLNDMQFTDVNLSDHIDAIQRNLSDLNGLARTLQTRIDALPGKDS